MHTSVPQPSVGWHLWPPGPLHPAQTRPGKGHRGAISLPVQRTAAGLGACMSAEGIRWPPDSGENVVSELRWPGMGVPLAQAAGWIYLTPGSSLGSGDLVIPTSQGILSTWSEHMDARYE